MKEINYSIIIPHYNIPELLVRCLKSIPVREDIQVIVVDDCSPGFDDYVNRYPDLFSFNVEFYSTPKGGSAGRARNVGLEHAKGKWLVFIDADDFVSENGAHILDKYVNYDYEILYFQTEFVMSDDITKKTIRFENINNFVRNYEISKDERSLRYNHDPQWSMLIRRDMVVSNNIRFDETRWGNDVMFSFLCGIYAKKINAFAETFFIVTQREGSLASSDFNSIGRSYEEYECRYDVFRRKYLIGHRNGVPKMDRIRYLIKASLDIPSFRYFLKFDLFLWRKDILSAMLFPIVYLFRNLINSILNKKNHNK